MLQTLPVSLLQNKFQMVLISLKNCYFLFTAAEHKRYNDEVRAYGATLGSTPIDQANLIAFKVFLIDKMAIERNIKEFDMLKGNKKSYEYFKKSF